MLYNICYIDQNEGYVARCLLYNKKIYYIAHPNLPHVGPDPIQGLAAQGPTRGWHEARTPRQSL